MPSVAMQINDLQRKVAAVGLSRRSTGWAPSIFALRGKYTKTGRETNGSTPIEGRLTKG